MNEYVGEKVMVCAPHADAIAVECTRSDAQQAADKACALKGLQASDVSLVWSGPVSDAPSDYEFCEVFDYPEANALTLSVWESTACEASA